MSKEIKEDSESIEIMVLEVEGLLDTYEELVSFIPDLWFRIYIRKNLGDLREKVQVDFTYDCELEDQIFCMVFGALFAHVSDRRKGTA
jgi:hypothetical protein